MKRQFFFAQKAFIVDGDRLLLVRKSMTDPHNPGRWEVPGGRMDFDEELDAHIAREVWEEVGLPIVPGSPFFLWQWRLARVETGEEVSIHIVAVARLCRPLEGSLTAENRVADDHLAEMEWVPLTSLTDYDFIPNMRPVIDAFLHLPEIVQHGR